VYTTHNKMLEAQIARQASFPSTPSNRLLSKLEPNPREQCSALILRGGKQQEGHKGVTNDESSHDKKEHVENDKKEMSPPSKEVIGDVVHKSDEVHKDSKITPPKPYTPPLPSPQRMGKARLDLQFEKFLQVLKKLYINIPFTEALTQMP